MQLGWDAGPSPQLAVMRVGLETIDNKHQAWRWHQAGAQPARKREQPWYKTWRPVECRVRLLNCLEERLRK